ncbi:PLD nuclease N-terminal domain-containing protein [Zunongwangia endophytica]|uniref:PLD nuclease N-terminal domain-containing protein n=1 Tax=Zunongwangia endophytica TaxID=1808945 RepID=A0ABV8H682_9FLAO|nr:PLD nuclease N-terminal domain-containing protein [Zunongwangia endophytica]MDN3594935.1 PLD nuclease N-terminal domain-containing protein [Zunongwangia endophytica]
MLHQTLAIGALQLILILITCLFALLFPLLAIIDIVRNDFKGNDKIVWLLVVIFFSFFGTLLYFVMGRKQRLT